MVSIGDMVAYEEWQIINYSEHSWQEDHNVSEREVDLEPKEIEKKDNTNLRILERTHDLQAYKKETQSIQQVDISAGKHAKEKNLLFGWTAKDRPFDVPPGNLSPAPSTGMSINTFVRRVRVGLTHTKNLMKKKLREMRKTNGLELDQKEVEPTLGKSSRSSLKYRMSFQKTP